MYLKGTEQLVEGIFSGYRSYVMSRAKLAAGSFGGL